MDELQLIEGCKAQKREFQKKLYEKYAGLMYSICLRYSQDEESAKDLLHDGFIKIFSAINSYSGKGSFEGWLKRIFINLALESFRKNKVKNQNFSDIENLSDIIDDGVEDRANNISEGELLNMVQDLPKGYKMVFNLYAIEDLSHREIANTLGISEGTSRSQYNRARQILQSKVLAVLKKNN